MFSRIATFGFVASGISASFSCLAKANKYAGDAPPGGVIAVMIAPRAAVRATRFSLPSCAAAAVTNALIVGSLTDTLADVISASGMLGNAGAVAGGATGIVGAGAGAGGC